MSSDKLVSISDLAVGQWGLLTTQQAAAEGIPRMQLVRLVDAGLLERVEQGVYAVASSVDDFQALHAAWLSLDPGATAEQRLARGREAVVASHTSAAALHGMGDLLYDIPELNTAERKQTTRPMRLHRLKLASTDVTLVDGLPTTTPERTIADLIRARHDLSHVADALRDGYRSGILDLPTLRLHLDPVASRTGHRDGNELTEHLLDLVGLSTAAIVKATARSDIGKAIASAAISQYQASLFELMGPELRKAMGETTAFPGWPAGKPFELEMQEHNPAPFEAARRTVTTDTALHGIQESLPKMDLWRMPGSLLDFLQNLDSDEHTNEGTTGQ